MGKDAMRRYVIIPYEKAGSVSFGMTRGEVRSLLGQEPDVFRRGNGKNESEMYDDFFVYYDDEDRCEGVEFWRGNEVLCCGLSLFECSFDVETERLRKIDPDLKDEKDICTSGKLGIGLWSSFGHGPEGTVDSVLAFAYGYLDG